MRKETNPSGGRPQGREGLEGRGRGGGGDQADSLEKILGPGAGGAAQRPHGARAEGGPECGGARHYRYLTKVTAMVPRWFDNLLKA